MSNVSARLVAAVVLGIVAVGCTRLPGSSKVDTEAATRFDAFPLYWVGERFEGLDLTHIELPGAAEFATFIYGDCTPPPGDGGCPPPLAIQISPLCAHLDVVARAPIWRHRRVRGAPVGTIDSAPVLFTTSSQVKVYRGQGSDPGLPMRALQALRSANDVEPVIGSTGPIPAPAAGVLEGTRPCTAGAP